MKLRNVGSKIVSVGKTVLMPDDEMVITAAEADLPSIKSLVGMGFLKIDKTEEAMNAPVESEATEVQEGSTEEVVPKRRGGRRKAETVEAAE